MRLVETRDDVSEAWRLAAEYRDTAIDLGYAQTFTVRQMRVARALGSGPTAYGVYMLEEGDDDDAG